MDFDVYGIGNALVDIQVQVNDSLLDNILTKDYPGFGGEVAKGSMHLVDTKFQGHLLQRLESFDMHTASGGSGCNTMFGLAQQGCRVNYAGKVGQDVYGAFYTEDLHAANVAFDTEAGTEATGTCIVMVTPDAERTMFTNLGISTQLQPSDIDVDAIKRSKWVYIEGYLWDAPGPRAASILAMETAKKHGVKIAYSYSDPFCVNRAREDFRSFTKEYVDLVFCNKDEALSFTGASDPAHALSQIIELGTNVALTISERGSMIAYDNHIYNIASVPVTQIDTTGAGDLYAAGVLTGLCRDYSIADAGKLGSELASQVIAVRGARLPHSTKAEENIRKLAAN